MRNPTRRHWPAICKCHELPWINGAIITIVKSNQVSIHLHISTSWKLLKLFYTWILMLQHSLTHLIQIFVNRVTHPFWLGHEKSSSFDFFVRVTSRIKYGSTSVSETASPIDKVNSTCAAKGQGIRQNCCAHALLFKLTFGRYCVSAYISYISERRLLLTTPWVSENE